jgi:hypothetical protein
MPAPPSDPTAADAASDTSLHATDAAPSSRRAVSAVESEPPPPSGVGENRTRALLVQFLASKEQKKGGDWIKRVIIPKLGDEIDPALVEVDVKESRRTGRTRPPVAVAPCT